MIYCIINDIIMDYNYNQFNEIKTSNRLYFNIILLIHNNIFHIYIYIYIYIN